MLTSEVPLIIINFIALLRRGNNIDEQESGELFSRGIIYIEKDPKDYNIGSW